MGRVQEFEGGRRHGDYEMHYDYPSRNTPLHKITALHAGQKVGHLMWGGENTVHSIGVEPEHQRRGLATAMWNYGHEKNPHLRHDTDRTEEGDAWAHKVGGAVPPLNKVGDWPSDRKPGGRP